jgi:insulin-like growth factor 2 receptor
MRNPPRREREDDQVGLVQGQKARKGKPRPGQKSVTSSKLVSFHDDSDEDLLHI